jgi:hypothetical protein
LGGIGIRPTADAVGLQPTTNTVDMWSVKFRTPTSELLARAFADAVAAGDLKAAEGWLATAAFVGRRHGDQGSGTTPGLAGRPSRRSRASR